MIARFFNWIFDGLTPVQVDGALFISIALFGTTQTVFSQEEAYKYINPYILFWIKSASAIILAGVGALKMFRSTAYGDAIKEKDKTS